MAYRGQGHRTTEPVRVKRTAYAGDRYTDADGTKWRYTGQGWRRVGMKKRRGAIR